MGKEAKGQFGSLFTRDLPGVDILPPDMAQTEVELTHPVTRAKPLAKSKDPNWMKTGILIRKTTNLKLRQYLLSLGIAQDGQPTDDMSQLVDKILSDWADKNLGRQVLI